MVISRTVRDGKESLPAKSDPFVDSLLLPLQTWNIFVYYGDFKTKLNFGKFDIIFSGIILSDAKK